MLDRIHKWLALRSYRGELGSLLVERYGPKRYYTPPQVLATIKVHALSQRYAAQACAMFCSKRAYEAFVAARRSRAGAESAPATGAPEPGWDDVEDIDLPSNFRSDGSDDASSNSADSRYDAGSDHGSGYDSGGYGGSHGGDGGGGGGGDGGSSD